MILKKFFTILKKNLDFFLFKTPYFDNKVIKGNVIFVSNLGQLNQAESIIKFNKIEESTLVILYTIKNMKMPEVVYSSANKNIFRSIYFYELPASPSKVNFKKFLQIKWGYYKLLKELKPKNVYIMSFVGHYATLLNLSKKIGAKLHLIEEGAGTYAPLSDSFSANTTKIEQFFQKRFVNSKNYFSNFDALHIPFPNYGKKIFHAKEYNYFFAHISGVTLSEKIISLRKKYNVSSNDYIYVSQLFPVIKGDVYYSIVIEYLQKILRLIDGKIYIKLHPKEMGKKAIMDMFLEKSKENPRLIVINEAPFLIEPFIYLVEPKGIIGITSTTLVYAPLLVPGIETQSIAELVINKLLEKKENPSLIKEHLSIFKNFNFINILKDIDFSKESDSYNTGLNFDELIKKAEISYKKRKYYHAIFYWQQAFKDNISLLGNKSLWYYNSLNKMGQTYKMKLSEIEYIDSIKDFSSRDVIVWENIKKSLKR